LRNAFAEHLSKISIRDKRICILSGDIGNRLFDEFKSLNKNRFINCGIAEANMVSVAAGMSQFGFLPFVYTITPFVTTRCLEQIKIDVAYHNLPVTIVGTGSGLSYAELGPTHHSFEDIAILRSIPDMRIFAPADAAELKACIDAILEKPAPSYIRIGKKGESEIPKSSNRFQIGKHKIIKKGSEILFVSMGNMTDQTIQIADSIGKKLTKNIEVLHVSSIKPFDENYFKRNIHRFNHIFTFEEHSLIGGLASAVSEVLAQNNFKIQQHSFGIKDKFLHYSISQQEARRYHKLDPAYLEKEITKLLNII